MNINELYEENEEKLAELTSEDKENLKKINEKYEQIKKELKNANKEELCILIEEYGELFTEYHAQREKTLFERIYKTLKSTI